MGKMSYIGKGDNINVFGYQTSYFINSQKAVEQFLSAMDAIETQYADNPAFLDPMKQALSSMAERVDKFLMLEAFYSFKSMTKESFERVSQMLVHAGMYNYKSGLNVDTQFLGEHLYNLCSNVKQKSFADGGGIEGGGDTTIEEEIYDDIDEGDGGPHFELVVDYYEIIDPDRFKYMATLIDSDDIEVWNCKTATVKTLIEEGHLQGKPHEDLAGLTKYLIDTKVIPENSNIHLEDDREGEGEDDEDFAMGGQVKYDSNEKKIKFATKKGNILTFKRPFRFMGEDYKQILIKGVKKDKSGAIRIEGQAYDTPWFKSIDELISKLDWVDVEKMHSFERGGEIDWAGTV